MPKVLWDATLNPQTPPPARCNFSKADRLPTDRIINGLIGKDASARFHFIMDRAEEADELDV